MRTSYGPTLHRLTACHSDWYSLNPNPSTPTAWKRISFGNSRTFGGPNLFPVFVYYVPLNGPQGVGWSTEHTYFDPCCNTIIRAQHAPTQDSDFDSTQIHGPPLILIGKGKNNNHAWVQSMYCTSKDTQSSATVHIVICHSGRRYYENLLEHSNSIECSFHFHLDELSLFFRHATHEMKSFFWMQQYRKEKKKSRIRSVGEWYVIMLSGNVGTVCHDMWQRLRDRHRRLWDKRRRKWDIPKVKGEDE